MGEDRIDIKALLRIAFRYWYLFAIVLPIALVGSYLYLQTTSPKYESDAMVLIKNDEGSGQLSEEAIFTDLGLNIQDQNLENEMLRLKSYPLIDEVITNLELRYQYFQVGRFRSDDLYGKSPVRILDWKPVDENFSLEAKLTVDEKGGFVLETEERTYEGEFGKELKLLEGDLTLSRNQEHDLWGTIGLKIYSMRKLRKSLLDRLSVEMLGEEASILLLSIRDESPARARDVLQELISVYNEKTIENKNKVFRNTIEMINDRIQLINEELSDAEHDVENYKSQFSISELSAEGSMLMTQMAEYNRTISSTQVQLQILDSIQVFLTRNKENFEFVPTNLSLTNLTLTNQLTNFNDLLVERARLRSNLGPSHPDLLLIERQIQNLRETIIENIQSIKTDLEITRDANVDRKDALDTRMRSLPRRERELIEIERRKVIKENLYLYLLQKREESAISMAVTAADAEVLEPPALPYKPVSPQRMQIWLIAFFLGLAIPAASAFLLEALYDRVRVEDEIEKLTSVPVICSLGYNQKKSKLVVKEKSHSAQAEMFRLLRTNLTYIGAGKNLKTLLITSSMSGEGKSFIALNLGMTQALTGKKVLILELDLRKPKQEEYIGVKKSEIGVVNYLVDPSVRIDEIIQKTDLHPNLEVITSGPKPPNPSELLLSDRLRDLMEKLKQRYDFIIIDAPPVGLVADALQMKDLSEATMYVVRNTYTRKGQLQIIEDIAEKEKLPKPFIVLNAVKVNKGVYGNGYSYGYGYGSNGNGNGYYYEEN